MYDLQKPGLYGDYMFSIVLIAAAPYSDFCSSVRSSSPRNSPTLDTRVSRMVESLKLCLTSPSVNGSILNRSSRAATQSCKVRSDILVEEMLGLRIEGAQS